MLALGWRGGATGNATRRRTCFWRVVDPLVLSVHTVVSFRLHDRDHPGWHSTIFPPDFVAGAIYAGFAMVLTLGFSWLCATT
jgi:molybdopterin-containing oxidoreductase family membrane subunit